MSEEETYTESEEAILNDKGFLGHPKGVGAISLGYVCNTMAWSAVYAVLIYYLYSPFTKGLGFTEGEAGTIISAMGAANSLFVIVGSWLADRVLGPKRALVLGNLLKAVAFGLLAIPAPTLEVGRVLGVLGIVCMSLPIMGASANSLIGMLYRRGDHSRRDAAFTITNVANSAAGIIAPILVGNLAAENYHIGFAVGSVWALLYAAVIFFFRRRFFGDFGEEPPRPLTKEEAAKFGKIAALVVVVALLALFGSIAANVLTFDSFITMLTSASFLIPIAFLVVLFRNKKITAEEHARLRPFLKLWIAYIFVMVASVLINSAIAIFIEAKVDRVFMGYEFAPATFTTIYSAYGVVIGPLFVWFWSTKLGKRIGTAQKFSHGILWYALAYAVMSVPVLLSMQGKVSALVPILFYLIMTFGDMIVFPVGLSVTARLAPKGYETQMQSAWGLANAVANAVCMVLMGIFTTADSQLTIFPIMTVVLVVVGGIVLLRAKSIDAELV